MGIVNILLAHDRLLALKTGHRILAIIALDASKILDSYMAEMIYNLLKPTIFDLKLIDSEKLTKMMESSSNLDMRIIDHRIEKSKDDHSSTFIKNQYGDIMSSSVLRNNAVIKQHSKTCNFRPNMWELMIDVIRTSIGTVQRGLAMIDLEM